VLQHIPRYFFGARGRPSPQADNAATETGEDPGLTVTGDALVERIYESISLRRSVLVTGPRGCGKTHCSEEAIKHACGMELRKGVPARPQLIGGWRFIQGNREIPRDTLSEDALVVGEGGTISLLTALALRPINDASASSPMRERFPLWPAIPEDAVKDEMECWELWSTDDWWVLFLDEVNRFGDGFLDSLLSLTEGRKIVRRGEGFYVPIVVVATANPPGYDATAKKLSPPLQARISRSFRVSQPPTYTLVRWIIESKLSKIAEQRPLWNADREHTLRVWFLAATVCACLWGDPASGAKGMFFLTTSTRARLRAAMERDPELAAAMTKLSTLITFGPDARAAIDWLLLAAALAQAEHRSAHQAWSRHRTGPAPALQIATSHLENTAVQVLGHKLRESFNEGTEPAKSVLKDQLILTITRRVLGSPELVQLFAALEPGEIERPEPGTARQAAQPAPEPPPPKPPAAEKPAPPLQPFASLQPAAPPPKSFPELLAGYPTAHPFINTLQPIYAAHALTLLRAELSVRLWLTCVDEVLRPTATPSTIDESIKRAIGPFYGVVRPQNPAEQSAAFAACIQLFIQTFHALALASNPAGAERAVHGTRALQATQLP
jgi:MoxR-like ATPase